MESWSTRASVQGFAAAIEVMEGYGQAVTGNLVRGYDMGNLLFSWPLVKAANSNGAAGNFLD
jgi:hypothetical protein